MAKDELGAGTDQIFAAMDFISMKAALEEKYRKQTTELLLGILGIVDALQALERHCKELTNLGHEEVPSRSVRVTIRQALQVLSHAGVVPMNPVGHRLDLDRHEVSTVVADSSAEADTVLEEFLSGYLWNGKLLRRAKVVISGEGGTGPAGTAVRREEDKP